MKKGDRVKVLGTPSGLRDDDDLKTATIFEKCVGGVFPIKGFENGFVELHVGRVVGAQSYEHMIWIEPEFLEIQQRKK